MFYPFIFALVLRVVSMGGCSLVLSMVLYLSESLYFRSSSLTFYVIFPCVLNSKFIDFWVSRFNILIPLFLSLSSFIHSNHIDWPYLHPKTVATLGHARRHGGRKLTVAQTDWRLQTAAQQENTINHK